MQKDIYCAYHHSKTITQFCQCPGCLLPVCPTCVTLHNKEHSQSLGNTPQYLQIGEVYGKVRTELAEVGQSINGLFSEIEEISDLRKKLQSVARKDIVAARKHILQAFESALLRLEDQLMESLTQSDKKFVDSLKALDHQVLDVQDLASECRQELESADGCLSLVIRFFHEHISEQYKQQLAQIDQNCQSLKQQQYKVCLDQQILHHMQGLVQDCLSVTVL